MTEFKGFQPPSSNYSKLPHEFIELLPEINSMAELKIMIYILRHTWGYSEYEKPKQITIEEFCSGRKKRDGTLIDHGTGMAPNSVRTGIKEAVGHGYLLVEIDNRDKARIRKSYCLNILGAQDLNPETGVQDLNPDMQDLNSRGAKVEHRTEKETKKENNTAANAAKRKKTPKTKKPLECPVQWKPIFDKFTSLHRLPLSESEMRFWLFGSSKGAMGIKHFAQLQITPDEIEQAYQKAMQSKMTIKNPNSLFVFADEIHRINGNGNHIQQEQPTQEEIEKFGTFLLQKQAEAEALYANDHK